jgi:hypothetical protein
MGVIRLSPLGLHLSQHVTHCRVKGLGQLLDNQDAGYPLATLQQAYVIAVKAGEFGQRFLRELCVLTSATQDGPESFLE